MSSFSRFLQSKSEYYKGVRVSVAYLKLWAEPLWLEFQFNVSFLISWNLKPFLTSPPAKGTYFPDFDSDVTEKGVQPC